MEVNYHRNNLTPRPYQFNIESDSLTYSSVKLLNKTMFQQLEHFPSLEAVKVFGQDFFYRRYSTNETCVVFSFSDWR
jgi:hypothetical protein